MNQNFAHCLKLILHHEGGYVNHPRDPGGATNRGITRKTLSNFLGRGASISDVKNISHKTVSEIYYKNYWRNSQCHVLPSGIDLIVFNAAVNCGPRRAARFLQRALNKLGKKVLVDQDIGNKTVSALHSIDTMVLIDQFVSIQMAYYKRLKIWPTFGRGWTRRTNEIKKAAKNMPRIKGEKQEMSPFDILIGSRFTGYKTIIAVITYVLLSAAQSHEVISLDPKLFDTLINMVTAFGGLSVMAKVERYLDMLGMGAKK